MEVNEPKAPASEPVEWDTLPDGWIWETDLWIAAITADLGLVVQTRPGCSTADLRAIADACDAKLAEVRGE